MGEFIVLNIGPISYLMLMLSAPSPQRRGPDPGLGASHLHLTRLSTARQTAKGTCSAQGSRMQVWAVIVF